MEPRDTSSTPTPAPVAVDDAEIASPPRPPTLQLRAVFAAVALVVFALAWTHRTTAVDFPAEAAGSLLSLAGDARAEVHHRAGAASDLLFSRREGRDDESAAPVNKPSPHVIRRDGHVSVPGGILVLPSSLEPADDGTFDLLVHFHGNTAVVRESADVAGLNAAVAIVNLGIGSAPYEEYYAVGGTYEDLLAAAVEGVRQRGVKDAKLGRVALSAWSAGYGAVSSILVSRKGHEHLDAILIFDGIHGSLDDGRLNRLQMGPFSRAATRAAKGEIYFGFTHSDIDPRLYAGTRITADYLIAEVGAERRPLDPVADQPGYLELTSMRGAVSKRLEKRMEPTSEARIGTLHVIGYKGETKEHHMAHLFQMGATLLPELVTRWSL